MDKFPEHSLIFLPMHVSPFSVTDKGPQGPFTPSFSVDGPIDASVDA